MLLMYSVKKVQLSELPWGIPSSRRYFVDVTSSICMTIVLSVRKFFIHRHMLLIIPAYLVFMKIPCLQTLSLAFSRSTKMAIVSLLI